jgi:competence protein ComEC
MRIDPVLVVLASLVSGAAWVVAPAATALAALVTFAVLARRLARPALLLAALALALGGARAHSQLAEHAERSQHARALLPAPSRCAARGRITASPTWLGGQLRIEAELIALDCEGHRDERPWPARLHLAPDRITPSRSARDVTAPDVIAPDHLASASTPASAAAPAQWAASEPAARTSAAGSPAAPPALARGDAFSVVADLAPVSEFRNFELPDPRPGAARRGALLSGGALAFELEARGSGPLALIDRARGRVRQRILATFGERVSPMARALVLGENDLDPVDERAFQQSGLSHLLAVSGTHLILAVLAFLRAVEAIARRVAWLSSRIDVRRPVALVGCCLGPLYADFAGGSGSAWRAAFMLSAVLAVRAAGRHVFPSRVLAASLGAGWLADGLVLFDPSFALSVAATTGLLAGGERLRETRLAPISAWAQPHRPDLGRLLATLSRAALTTLAASLPCVPILLTLSPGVSLASVAANLLAAPVGEVVALPLCLAHALCAPLPALERGLAFVASAALALIRSVAHAAASVEWLYFELPPPNAWHLAVLVAGMARGLAVVGRPWLCPLPGPEKPAAPGRSVRSARAAAATLLALLAVELVTRWQHSATRMRLSHRLRVTALDVGQGDATLIDLPDGRLMLIDGGGFVGVPIDPGERVLVPTLRARRRHRIDILVLTHAHPDHYGGLASVVQQVEVGEFWYGGEPASASEAPAAAAASLPRLLQLLRQRGARMRTSAELCAAGGHIDDALQLLHPCPARGVSGSPSGSPFDAASDDLSGAEGADGAERAERAPSVNDASLVLRIRHGRHAALLVGDAEHWAEQRLLATRPDALDADFLKVGHHGSRTSSSPEFVARVTPVVASISCGIRNRFGHPHAEALAHLAAAGAHIVRLDLSGAVRWQSDGQAMGLDTFAPAPAPPR